MDSAEEHKQTELVLAIKGIIRIAFFFFCKLKFFLNFFPSEM